MNFVTSNRMLMKFLQESLNYIKQKKTQTFLMHPKQ